MIQILNQLFDMQAKLTQLNMAEPFSRNMARLIHICQESGYTMHDPLGEKYADSRTDCEANIIGKLSSNMIVSQVVKPIVYQTLNNEKSIVQKGIVMIESK
jgi:hypothetical protein